MNKGKAINCGWIVGFFLMFGGVGTMESSELGSWEYVYGLLLMIPFFVFNLLMIINEEACEKERKRFEEWCDKLLSDELHKADS